MQIFLVGGAVRDQLLGLEVKERDWVVVGATPQQMLRLGFKPVGKDFPVFLHPKTHEEYALARTERKVARGYKGFKFYASSKVTLEQDLHRRDLTINAMAMDDKGALIDPFYGQRDLKDKVLRHVSPAFAEDPVRILRVARFAARFGKFTLHKATLRLMKQMVQAGEVEALVAERVWQELARSLVLDYAPRFFEILNACNALDVIFPEIKQNYQRCMLVLKRAVARNNTPIVRFVALLSVLTEQQIRQFCNRNRVPSDYKNLAILMVKHQSSLQNIMNASAKELLQFLERTDAFRRSLRFFLYLEANGAIEYRKESPKVKLLECAYIAANKISSKNLLNHELTGEEIRDKLRIRRQKAIEQKCIRVKK